MNVKMKTTVKYLSMALLALAGTALTACSGADDDGPVAAMPAAQGRAVTMTTTFGLSSNATTRALTLGDGKLVKTFAPGEQIAIWYESSKYNGDDYYRCAVTEPLKATDISADGKSATITVTFYDPLPGGLAMCFYPAYMGAPEAASIKDYYNHHGPLEQLLAAEQDGTLEYIAANLDYTEGDCFLTEKGELPASIEMENCYPIFAFTFLNEGGSVDLTPRVKELVVNDFLTVRRKEPLGDGPIYFIKNVGPIINCVITTIDGKKYTKTVENDKRKPYEEGKFYKMSLKMTPVAPASPEQQQDAEKQDYSSEEW